MRYTRGILERTTNTAKTGTFARWRPLLRRKVAAIGIFSAILLMTHAASAEEDCYNGPVPVNGAHRGQITIPRGHSVRLTFNFNAEWEDMIYVCDALTGHRILVKGNYASKTHRDSEDWVSPIDKTRSLAYYVVAFHKTVSPDASDADKHPWFQSPMKRGDRINVEGQGGAFVDSYGFNDSGGERWDNSLVTAYFIGIVGSSPGALPRNTLQSVRANLRATPIQH